MTLRPWECSCRTCSAEVSNRSTSYTWAFTLRSKGPVSCHCQLTCAGGFQRPTGSAAGRWKPPAHVTWQWQLTGPLDLSVNAQVYDVDLFDTSAEQVRQLHSQGRKVICYL